MTLKEYLEKQIRHYAKARQEARDDTRYSEKFDGMIQAYTDILLTCPDSMLNKKILDEVW
jgi:hypothetical protein